MWLGVSWPRLDLPGLNHVTSHHISFVAGDDLLRQFWEIEEQPNTSACLSSEDRVVLLHLKENHYCSDAGRFVIPLPKRLHLKALGESCPQAVRRSNGPYTPRVNLSHLAK